ncbi:MAG: DUF6567 family protein [Balneolaceae bacterium]
MRNFTLLTFLSSILFLGCSNTGAFISGNQTIVNLNEGNYSIAETNITGESSAGYVFGLSYSTGFMASTFAIARVEGSGMLYAEALEDLWENYESAHGPVSNQQLALTNVRYDTDILNLFVYTKVKITVRADVVEFQ